MSIGAASTWPPCSVTAVALRSASSEAKYTDQPAFASSPHIGVIAAATTPSTKHIV